MQQSNVGPLFVWVPLLAAFMVAMVLAGAGETGADLAALALFAVMTGLVTAQVREP